jgi:uncharacterized radical SAM superfamily Fe-S cluster-containing enzyme
METLGITQSTCNTCRKIVPTKVLTNNSEVYFQKFCAEHGNSQNLVHNEMLTYLETQRYVKPAWIPQEFFGESGKPCPQGCGFCERHEQHLCMPIVEITSRCNLACPVCIADAGQPWDMTVKEFKMLIGKLILAEKQIDVLNLSGGEPLLHPQLLEIVDEALSHPEVVRVTISTNGLRLLQQPSLVHRLHERSVLIALQFDGFDDNAYEVLRGRKLLKQKLCILNLLSEAGISTSLTFTAASQINTDQLRQTVDYLFAQPHVISMMIQPLCFAGRASGLCGQIHRLVVSDITKLLDGTGNGCVSASDFVPLPCSHPLCFSLGYYLVCDSGDIVSLNRLVDASRMLDSLANRTIFGLDSGEYDRLKDMVYEMWSGPAASAPDSNAVMKTLRSILDEISRSRFDPRSTFSAAERRIKSIFIHAFQDVGNFDLSRARRCCQAYPQTDGELIPGCVHNVLRRDSSALWAACELKSSWTSSEGPSQ